MNTIKKYICPECGGEVQFNLKPTTGSDDKVQMHYIIINEEPGECQSCHKYFYTHECKEE